MTAMAAAGPSRRDWYLANLGVVRYLPRDALGAAQGAPADPAAEAPEAPPAAPAPVQATDHLRAALATPPTTLPAAQTHAAKAPPRAEGAPPFECRLGFWQPRADLVVLCAMPPGQRPAGEQLTMLANLLKAIGRLGDGLPPVDLMDWPQAPHLGLQGVPVDIAGARDFVAVFLAAKRRLQAFDHVLLMGKDAARVAGAGDDPAVGEQLDLPCGARGIVTHSLHGMAQNPALKAETWQAIRFLAG
ncbi:MAG TPA: hypothetical protein VK018_00590 [Porticoccaceae bacterium]|nr:hypothetical protein [Porticoccaceae bacterium]